MFRNMKILKALSVWCLLEFCLAWYRVTVDQETTSQAISEAFEDLIEAVTHACQITYIVATKLIHYSPIIATIVGIITLILISAYIKEIYNFLKLIIRFIPFFIYIYVIFLLQSLLVSFVLTHIFHVHYMSIAEILLLKTTAVLMQIKHFTPIIHSIATKIFDMDYATMEQVIATKLSSLAH